jgi:WD40 repeat protein
MWNFSNGQQLTELKSAVTGRKVDTEVTAILSLHDPKDLEEDPEDQQPCFIAAVGWDKKIHIWQDDKDEEVETVKILPTNNVISHKHDIMSAVYDYHSSTPLIYTGGHDGTIFAWNRETGTCKYQLHNSDPTCTSENFIRDSKSVDQMVVLEKRKKLVSMTPD